MSNSRPLAPRPAYTAGGAEGGSVPLNAVASANAVKLKNSADRKAMEHDMDLKGKTIGYALTGSFCTFSKSLEQMKALKAAGATVIPIMSETASVSDTRFGTAADFRHIIKDISGNGIIDSIKGAEPFGPKALLDLLIIAPCTGNTLAKTAAGITDSSVTMAFKAHLRNARPVLIGVSTNDGLGNAAKNIGALLNNKHIYFIPFGQDDCINKPMSLVADFHMLLPAARAALEEKQLQPVLL